MTYRATARGLVGVGLFGALACGGPSFSSDSSENDAGRGGAAAHSGGTKASGGAAGQGPVGSGGTSSAGSGSSAGHGGNSGTAGIPQAGGSAGASSGGVSSGGASSGGGGAVPDCQALAEDAREKLTAAQTCLVGGIVPECQHVVPGLCCPAVIANKASELAKAYLAALAAVNEASCQIPCPLVACTDPSGGTCRGVGDGQCVAGGN